MDELEFLKVRIKNAQDIWADQDEVIYNRDLVECMVEYILLLKRTTLSNEGR